MASRAAKFCLCLLSCLVLSGPAAADEICLYQDASGAFKQVNKRSAVPPQYSAKASCFESKGKNYLAPPEAVNLDGNTRSSDFAGELGRVQARWLRSVEQHFGRSPERALADSFRAVKRALAQGGFPHQLKTLNQNWKVVFLDESLPEEQIPQMLVSNCHPAWMTPPANIYVVSQRVVAGCGGEPMKAKDADAKLTEILIHEIGHALEYQLGGMARGTSKVQSEGFATWFEQYASDYSSLIPKGSVRTDQFKLARQAIKQGKNLSMFDGSAEDYALASLVFHAVVDKKRINGLMEVYANMQLKHLDFRTAVMDETGWSEKSMQAAIIDVLK